ncbi:MAG: hypothetical protein JWN41_208 [Thermoleophilia bacterium]|nr:hypothetical protein [Thermoleophilia bacterium]
MAVYLHYKRELDKVIVKATVDDREAIDADLETASLGMIEILDVKPIRGHKPIQEIRVWADNTYRIFYTTEEGDDIHCWAYSDKGGQDRAIRRAATRHAKWKASNK